MRVALIAAGRGPMTPWATTFAATVVLIVGSTSEARTWVVEPDGSGDAPSLLAAADSAATGDSILVQPGTYSEFDIRVADGVSVIGVGGAAVTVIDGGAGSRGVSGNNLLLEGLTFVGLQQTGYGFQYAVGAGDVSEVRGCVFDVLVSGIVADQNLTVAASTFSTRSRASIHLSSSGNTAGALLVDDCVFDASGTAVVLVQEDDFGVGPHAIEVTVRDSEFMDCAGSAVIGYDVDRISVLTLVVEGNVFARNSVDTLVGPVLQGVIDGPRGGSPVDVRVVGNTMVRTTGTEPGRGYALGQEGYPLPSGTWIERNAITGNDGGVFLAAGGSFHLLCNNVWGNGEQNWQGVPDPTGTDGNLSEPPFYCGAAAGNFALAQNSPMLPGNNVCSVLIGALGQGCGPVSVEPVSWGGIKALYRDP